MDEAKEKSLLDLVKENLEASASKITPKQFNSPLPVGNVKQKLAQFQRNEVNSRAILPAKSVKARAAALNSRSELGPSKFKQMTPLPRRKYAVKTIVSKIDKEHVMESPLLDAKVSDPEPMTPSRKAAVTAKKVTTKRTGSGRLLRSFQDKTDETSNENRVESDTQEIKNCKAVADETPVQVQQSVEIPSNNKVGQTIPTTPTKPIQSAPNTPEKEFKTPKLAVRRSGRNSPRVETPVLPVLKPAYAANTSSPLRKVIFTRVETHASSKVVKPKRKREEEADFEQDSSVDTENAPKRACVNSDGSVGKTVFTAPPLQTWLDRSMSKLSRTLFGLQ